MVSNHKTVGLKNPTPPPHLPNTQQCQLKSLQASCTYSCSPQFCQIYHHCPPPFIWDSGLKRTQSGNRNLCKYCCSTSGTVTLRSSLLLTPFFPVTVENFRNDVSSFTWRLSRVIGAQVAKNRSHWSLMRATNNFNCSKNASRAFFSQPRLGRWLHNGYLSHARFF